MVAETYGVMPEVYVLWGKEGAATYGTAATTITNCELMQNISMEQTDIKIPVRGLGAREVKDIGFGTVDGRLSGELVLQDMKMLTCLGIMDDTTTSTYIHTIDLGSTVGSGTFELGHNGTADVIYKATGAVINSWTLNATVDDVCKVSFEALFSDIDDTDTTAQTPSFKTTSPFTIKEIEMLVNDSVVDEVNNFSITVNNNLAMYKGFNDTQKRYTIDAKGGPVDVTWTFNANMRDTTLLTLQTAAAKFDLELLMSESVGRSILFSMNNCWVESWSEAVDVGGGIVNVTMSGLASYDGVEGAAADKQAIRILDTNSIATDYNDG